MDEHSVAIGGLRHLDPAREDMAAYSELPCSRIRSVTPVLFFKVSISLSESSGTEPGHRRAPA